MNLNQTVLNDSNMIQTSGPPGNIGEAVLGTYYYPWPNYCADPGRMGWQCGGCRRWLNPSMDVCPWLKTMGDYLNW